MVFLTFIWFTLKVDDVCVPVREANVVSTYNFATVYQFQLVVTTKISGIFVYRVGTEFGSFCSSAFGRFGDFLS